MYNCVICVYICVIVVLVLLVSVGFKTSGQCLLKGGKYVTRSIRHFTSGRDKNNCRLPYRIKYQELCSSQALELVVFADKYYTSVTS